MRRRARTVYGTMTGTAMRVYGTMRAWGIRVYGTMRGRAMHKRHL